MQLRLPHVLSIACHFLSIAAASLSSAQTPVFDWVRSAGGTNQDWMSKVAVDSQDNIYVVGSLRNVATFGNTNLNSFGDSDGFLAKYSPAGTLLWIQQFGGSGIDYAQDIVATTNGDCFVTGYYTGTARFGSQMLTSIGSYDIFVARFNNSGELQWVRSAGGGSSGSSGEAITIDTLGNVYVTGFFTGTCSFGSTNVTTPRIDSFIARYNGDGAIQWVQQGQTTSRAYARAIGIGHDGFIYAGGYFEDSVNLGGLTLTRPGSSAAYFAKLTSAGSGVWIRAAYGGGGAPGIIGIGSDVSGNCYLAGGTEHWVQFDNSPALGNGGFDGFLAKFNSQGQYLWGHAIGSTQSDGCSDLLVDRDGNCFVTGDFQGAVQFGNRNLTSAGNYDIFLGRFNADGLHQWAYRAGGSSVWADRGSGIAVDSRNRVYVVGSFGPGGTFDGIAPAHFGESDGFIAKRVLQPPRILAPPQPRTAVLGSSASFTVTIASDAPPMLQWQQNGTNVTAGTNSILTLNPVQLGHAGNYRVVVSNCDGAITSAPASLTVRASLNLLTNGSGTVTSSPAGPTHAPYTEVTVTAAAAASYGFGYWSGNAVGNSNPLTVVMDTNKTIIANFVSTALRFSIQGSGTVTKSPDKAFYDMGEEVTATAFPGRWFRFHQWGDGRAENPRVITIGTNNNYSVIFFPTTAVETLTFSNVTRTAPVGMPAIFVDDAFMTNSTVTRVGGAGISMLTTFANGSIFFTLDGSEPSFGSALYNGPFSLRRSVLIRAIAYDANFERNWEADAVRVEIQPVYTIDSSTEGGGTISVMPASAYYRSNDLVNLTGTAAPGWQFLQWLGDVGGTNPSTSLRVTRNSCVKAMFGTTLNLTQVGNGIINVDPSAPVYPYGSTIRLSAIPASDSYFAAWGNAASSTNNPLLFPVTNANPTVSCAFGSLPAGQSALSVTINGRGRVLPSPRPNRVNSTQTITLTAVPDPDQAFLGWSGDATSTHTNLTLSMNQSRVITASFTSRSRLLLGPCLGGWSAEGFRFTLSGDIGRHYSVETSPTAEGWTPLVTITNHFGIAQFLNPATNSPQRFYRARLLP